MKNKLQKTATIALVVAFISAAIYLGLWVCLVGGIVSIVEAVKKTPVSSMGIALGILRVLLTGVAFWACIAISAITGKILWPSNRSF